MSKYLWLMGRVKTTFCKLSLTHPAIHMYKVTRNMIPNGALMIGISLVQDCDCRLVPHIFKLKERYIKVICYFQINFFYCLLRPCNRVNRRHGLETFTTKYWYRDLAYSSKPKMTLFEVRTRDIHTPAKRASRIVQDFWGGLNLALKFSLNNFYTENLCSLGHCFEYKSGSTSSNTIM